MNASAKNTSAKTSAAASTGRFWLLWALAALALWFFFPYLENLLRHFPEPIGSRADLFAAGARMTFRLTLEAGLWGLFLGLVFGLLSLHRFKILRWPAAFVVWILRGTPLLVQILFAYFALPSLMPWLQLSDFSAALLALAFNVGAYNAEVLRAGILAVPRGQREAAESLGLSRLQVLVFVILPQALRIVVPPLVNNLVALLKDSSLASSIGLLELSLAGSRISSETFQPVPVLTTVAVVYLLLTTVVTLFTHALERRLRRAPS